MFLVVDSLVTFYGKVNVNEPLLVFDCQRTYSVKKGLLLKDKHIMKRDPMKKCPAYC